MKSFRLAIVLSALMFCLCRVSAAQNVYGSTTIDIDPDSGNVTATCETDFDGALDGNYEAEVICSVTDQNGTQVAWGSGADQDGTAGYAQAVLTFSGTPGSTYTATGIHHAIAVLVEQQFLKTVYEDPYNFSNSFESVDGDNYPNYYDWFGPGPEQQTKTASIRLGETKDTKNYPKATITLAFTPSGTKNSQDNLNFVPTGTHTCSNTLGPKDCTAFTGWWLYDLEGTIVVSDDASKWTVKQTKNSIVYSGNTKDANGVLHPFSNTLPFNNAPDGPDAPGTLQQASGSTTIFWIDAPGRNQSGDDGNPIDSLTWVQNYTINVCSTVLTSICYTQSWYVKLVVNPGGLLSPTASIAALGSSN